MRRGTHCSDSSDFCIRTDALTHAPQDNIEEKAALKKAKLEDFQYEKTLGRGIFGVVSLRAMAFMCVVELLLSSLV